MERFVIYINWIGRSDHLATIESNHIHKYAYFLKHPHGRPYDKNEIVLDYVFDNIFKHIEEGKRYDCKVINGKIVEIIEIK